jgi:hypothetical protein
MSNRAFFFPLPRLRGRAREGALASQVSAGEVAPSLTLPRKRGREKTAAHLIQIDALTFRRGLSDGLIRED